ncbi:MAG: hypothetical protein BroJett003_20870 [Planctomycetota bacterium]|nr:MAG: hypothetical protein BroJett003_20870 [Planctomycetota bacterium]
MNPATNIPERLLRNRNFLLLWCAYGISAIGDHLTEIAILKTQNAADPSVDATPLTARMTFMFFLPFTLLGPMTGMLADRFPRRGLMIFADVARFALMLGFVALVPMMHAWGPWWASSPLLLLGVFAAVFAPARSALVPALIRSDQLTRANGMISGLGIIATMVAQLLGGWIAFRYPAGVAFVCDAVTFAVSACLIFLIRVPSANTGAGTRVSAGGGGSDAAGEATTWRGVAEGFRYVLGHRRVLELIAAGCIVWFCGALVNSSIPAVVRDVYERPDYQVFSFYRALIGGGFILGSLVVITLGDAMPGDVFITWGLAAVGAGLALFGASAFMHGWPEAASRVGAAAVVLGGIGAVTVMAAFSAQLQRIVPNRFRGRVFGVSNLSSTAALLLCTGGLAIPAWERLDRWVGGLIVAAAGLAFASAAASIRIRVRRSPHRPWILFLENVNQFLTKFWWRMRVVNKPTVPHKGGVLVVANHTCYGDPLLLLGAVPYRPFGFLVAKEYTEMRVLGWFMRVVDCIPVKRDGMDAAATRRAMRHLRDGGALGIFIEGRIVPPGEPSELKDGVAMLALATGAKLVPAHISGTHYYKSLWKGMFVRHRARVRFGKPIDLSAFAGTRDRETVRRVTGMIFERIQDLGRKEETATEGRAKPASAS